MKKYGIKSTILKSLDPKAMQDPIFARIEANSIRIANDPNIRREHKEAADAYRREMLPFLLIVLIINAALYVAMGYYMSAIIPPAVAVVMCAATSGMFCRLFRFVGT